MIARMIDEEPIADSSESTVQTLQNQGLVEQIIRKRIAISVSGFAVLIAFNLLVLRTQPFMPFDFRWLAGSIGTGLVVAGLAIRSWAAGTLHKSAEVTSVGPYSLTRNPLYVGSFLMMFGFCILMKDWLAMAFAAGPLAMLYWYQVRAEERNLATWFGSTWEQYAISTGRFFPYLFSNQQRKILNGWSAGQWFRNREYQAIIATVIGLAALVLLATF